MTSITTLTGTDCILEVKRFASDKAYLAWLLDWWHSASASDHIVHTGPHGKGWVVVTRCMR